jgi:hypothetical protein
MPIYENQKKASDELIEGIKNGHRYQILIAQMQSGKTSTYFITAFRALQMGLVSNVIIFTGNRENELREQCEKDHQKLISCFVVSLAKDGFAELITEELLETLKEKVKVYWGQDLSKAPRIKHNTLIVWEESHFAQSIGNQPDYFRQRNLFEVNGSKVLNEMADIFIISISATPFSEISDEIHFNQGKKIVKLEPSKGYRGVEDFYNDNKIVPIPNSKKSKNDSIENWSTSIHDVMMKWSSKTQPKYHLFRGSEKGKNSMIALAQKFGFNILEHTSEKSDLKWEIDGNEVSGMSCLAKKPLNHTIVFIKQMCRMGKVVPKHHIGFVFESAVGSNADTILQGLLGRMCGYDYGGNNDFEIYIPEIMFDKKNGFNQLERYINFFKNIDMIPTRAMNLAELAKTGTKRRFTSKRYPCIQNLDKIIPYDNVPVIIPREKRQIFVNRCSADNGEIIMDIRRNIELFYVDNYQEHVNDMENALQHQEFISKRNFKASSSYVEQKRDIQMITAIKNKTGVQLWSDVDKIEVCEMMDDYINHDGYDLHP